MLIWPSTIFVLLVIFLFSACRNPDMVLPWVSTRPSSSFGYHGLTLELLCATATSWVVHFCLELCRSSDGQLNSWIFPCHEISHDGCVSRESHVQEFSATAPALNILAAEKVEGAVRCVKKEGVTGDGSSGSTDESS